jgi:polyhydroxybutyrate depolymerase
MMRATRTARGALAALVTLLLAPAARAVAQAPVLTPLTPGDHTIVLEYGGRARSYLAHVPATGTGRRPVVLSFHGGGGNAAYNRRHHGWDTLADSAGFVVVYPNGTGRFPDRLLTWNAGACCGYAQRQDVDDVGFVRAVLADLARRVRIDRSRVYATGLSNGGMFVYRLAAEAADVIAAVAPVSGAAAFDSIRATRPVPIMHIHSVDDPRALYEGGLGPPFPLTQQRVLHPPVRRALAQWIAHNHCPAEPRVAEQREGAQDTPDDGQSATKLVWGPCAAGTEIVHWRLVGAGHMWPGAREPLPERLVGPPTRIIDATREIWAFFSRHSLPPRTHERL